MGKKEIGSFWNPYVVIQEPEISSTYGYYKTQLLPVFPFITPSITALLRETSQESKDYPYLALHHYHTGMIAVGVAKHVGHLSQGSIRQIFMGAIIHDNGKSERQILPLIQAPRRLKKGEIEAVKEHAFKGYERAMLFDIARDPSLATLYHHKRWDGGGYPEQFVTSHKPPFSSWLVGLGDVVDAVMDPSRDAYRPPFSPQNMRQMVLSEMGSQFNPQLSRPFISWYQDIIGKLGVNSPTREEFMDAAIDIGTDILS